LIQTQVLSPMTRKVGCVLGVTPADDDSQVLAALIDRTADQLDALGHHLVYCATDDAGPNLVLPNLLGVARPGLAYGGDPEQHIAKKFTQLRQTVLRLPGASAFSIDDTLVGLIGIHICDGDIVCPEAGDASHSYLVTEDRTIDLHALLGKQHADALHLKLCGKPDALGLSCIGVTDEMATEEQMLIVRNRGTIREMGAIGFADLLDIVWPLFEASKGRAASGEDHTICWQTCDALDRVADTLTAWATSVEHLGKYPNSDQFRGCIPNATIKSVKRTALGWRQACETAVSHGVPAEDIRTDVVGTAVCETAHSTFRARDPSAPCSATIIEARKQLVRNIIMAKRARTWASITHHRASYLSLDRPITERLEAWDTMVVADEKPWSPRELTKNKNKLPKPPATHRTALTTALSSLKQLLIAEKHRPTFRKMIDIFRAKRSAKTHKDKMSAFQRRVENPRLYPSSECTPSPPQPIGLRKLVVFGLCVWGNCAAFSDLLLWTRSQTAARRSLSAIT